MAQLILVVSNEDKSNDFSQSQLKNMPYISVTLVVSKEDNFNDFKDLQ